MSFEKLSQEEYNKIREKFILKYSHWQKKVKIVSLGWDCLPRTIFTWWGIKKTKENGELSYPFDLSMHNLSSTIKILRNNFEDYLKDIYFEENTKLWKNYRYNIIYNHDKSITSKEEFRNRYWKRILNFNQTIQNEDEIFFIYHALHDDKQEDIQLLSKELLKLRNGKKYHLIVISDTWKRLKKIQNVSLCFVPLPSEKYEWWNIEHFSDRGIEYERQIIEKCISIFKQELFIWKKTL